MAEAQINLENLIQTLPCFDGRKESNIKFYIEQFDELARETKLSDVLKVILLKAKFQGNAREILASSADLNEEKNYQNLKDKLINEFQAKTSFEEAQNNFMILKQEPNQTITEFTKIFNLMASQYMKQSGHDKKPGAIDFLNTVKLTKFLDAIRPDIALEIRKNGPKDFEAALEIAKKIEIAFNAAKYEEVNTSDREQNTKLYESLINISQNQVEEIKQLKAEMNNLKLGKTENVTKIEKKCEICKTTTHDLENCWFNSKGKNFIPNYRAQNNSSQNERFQPQLQMPIYNNQRWENPQRQQIQYYNQRQSNFSNARGNHSNSQFFTPRFPIRRQGRGYYQANYQRDSNNYQQRYNDTRQNNAQKYLN